MKSWPCFLCILIGRKMLIFIFHCKMVIYNYVQCTVLTHSHHRCSFSEGTVQLVARQQFHLAKGFPRLNTEADVVTQGLWRTATLHPKQAATPPWWGGRGWKQDEGGACRVGCTLLEYLDREPSTGGSSWIFTYVCIEREKYDYYAVVHEHWKCLHVTYTCRHGFVVVKMRGYSFNYTILYTLYIIISPPARIICNTLKQCIYHETYNVQAHTYICAIIRIGKYCRSWNFCP